MSVSRAILVALGKTILFRMDVAGFFLKKYVKASIPRNTLAQASFKQRSLVYRSLKKNDMPPGYLSLDYETPIGIEEAKTVDFSIQEHFADRAGRHYDIRIIVNGKAYSFATKKDFPRKPGSIIGVFLQPVHTEEYSHWEGEIPKGKYGSGTVKIWDSGKAVIKASDQTPKAFKIDFFGQKLNGSYAFIPGKGEKSWMMIRMKPVPTLPQVDANEYTSKVPEEVWNNPRIIAENKIDGANFTAYVTPRGLVFVSRRLSVDGRPINRTNNVPHLRDIKLPSKYSGTVVQGELAVVKRAPSGLWIANYEATSGTLNSLPYNAVAAQEKNGKIYFFPFEVIRSPQVARTATYGERREFLERFSADCKSPYVKMPESATVGKKEFFKKVVSSSVRISGTTRHGEGIILKDLDGDKRTVDFSWAKEKASDTFDLSIAGFTEGEGRLSGKGVGAILLSDKSGRIVGKVGSGISDEEREAMSSNPDAFIGRVVEVKAFSITPSGNLRGARLERWRDDKSPTSIDRIDPLSVSPSNRSLPIEKRMIDSISASNPESTQREVENSMYAMKSASGWKAA